MAYEESDSQETKKNNYGISLRTVCTATSKRDKRVLVCGRMNEDSERGRGKRKEREKDEDEDINKEVKKG